MNWFLNINTRAKLFLSFGLMILFLLVVIVVGYQDITALQASAEQLYELDFANAQGLKDIRSNQNAVRANLFALLVTTDTAVQKDLQDDIKLRSDENADTIQQLLELNAANPAVRAQLEAFNTIRLPYRETYDQQIIPMILNGETVEAAALLTGIQEDRNQQMRAIANQLVSDAENQAELRVTESRTNVNRALLFFAIFGLIALVAGIGLTLYLSSVIASPLNQLSLVAEKIAGGDLTISLPTSGRRDEVGALASSFRRMVESLREVNREILEGVNVLASSSSEILASTTQLASGAAETAAAVTETTTTVEEVKQTAEMSTQKARYVSETAQKSLQVSQTGKQTVSETVKGINRIREQMESIAESIVRLSEQSQMISEITSTVNDLAEQSNLLSVNAAIEAAKAGEQGKGFSVVAQEVKSLAEQSKQATAQVRTILADVQKATSAAVMATEQGSKAVETGSRQSNESGDTIRTLADIIAEAAQATTQIAASSSQQLAGMDQVAQAMENIKAASNQNVASARQAEVAAKGLHDLGQRLKEIVGRYKL